MSSSVLIQWTVLNMDVDWSNIVNVKHLLNSTLTPCLHHISDILQAFALLLTTEPMDLELLSVDSLELLRLV